MSKKVKLDRRGFLFASAASVVGVALSACGATQPAPAPATAVPTKAPAPATPKAPVAAAATPTTVVTAVPATAVPTVAAVGGEAPMLAEQVKAGKLPPLTQRLPAKSLVIAPITSIGEYGGTIRTIVNAQGAHWVMAQYGNSPLRWIDDGFGIIPGMIESYSSNADTSEWTLNFRKGLKWSDGQPCTVDDVIFWWKDMVVDPDQSDAPPEWATAAGKLAEFIKIDDFTLKIKYAGPAPLTARQLAMWPKGGTGPRWIVPAHYVKQFHPKHNSQYKDFKEFDQKILWRQNPDCPTLTAWRCEKFEPGVVRMWARNPYYYAVDTKGNQLPYIDYVEEKMIADPEAQKLTVMQGGVDFACHGYNIYLADVATLKQNEEKGGFEVRLWDSGDGTGRIIYLNHDHPDAKVRALFRNPKFKQALSYAHDRATIQKTVYFNTGILSTGSYSPKAIEFNFNDEAKKQFQRIRDAYVQYDPEKAKKLLDEIGVKDVNNDGWREMPDGTKLEMRVDISATATSDGLKVLEMFKKTWNGIGLNVIVNQMPATEFGLFWQSGKGMVRTDWEVGDGPDHFTFIAWHTPAEATRWAPLSGNMWLFQGTEKEKQEADKTPWDRQPPRFLPAEKDLIGETVLKLQDISRRAMLEVDEVKRHAMAWQIYDVHINEGPFLIGCVANIPRVIIVSKKLVNVPQREQLKTGGFVTPWIMVYPGITNPETYYYKKA
ncbi:MAG: ABC transporter substrate-binding protein [Chloroflexi bacterium]|nr:ABC transporter substrate-binding protein [Chloroflexota bacterium]